MVSLTFNPIGSWGVVAVTALVVTGLTVWAYVVQMRRATGAWRWFALSLRLAAVLLCVIAALRPSVVFPEKKKQAATLVFLTDHSTSMTIGDEVNGQRRWDVARKAIAQARTTSKTLGEDLTAQFYRFDSALRDDPASTEGEPAGHATSMGGALLDAVKRQGTTRVAAVFLLSDGSNNQGISPVDAARQLAGQSIPVVTVGFGSETAGAGSVDIAVRDLATSPTVFVKNQMLVRGTLLARGFANQTVEVELLVEGEKEPVARRVVKIPEGPSLIPIEGLAYIPTVPGEKKVTLRVAPQRGELVTTNNEVSTFVKVLKGGLNVLFLQGPHSPWERKYFIRAVASSPDIYAEPLRLTAPAARGLNQLKDEDFAPGRYDVYVLSDLPASYLTNVQQSLLARRVNGGAGLIMLGGRSSFGEGGWDKSEVAGVLPVTVRAGDGQIEPEGGVKFVPNPLGLESYLMQVGPNAAESARIWAEMPPVNGINHLGEMKRGASLFGQTAGPRPEPMMVGMDVGNNGRSLAFAGETWFWSRFSEESQAAHRKFWRQVIFWLAHKEDQGESEVKITLDKRRISVGQKLDVDVSAKDARGEALKGLTFETRVEGVAADGKTHTEKLDLFTQSEGWRGQFYATDAPPGDYKVTATASRGGKVIGSDTAKFLVYLDDRELTDPAANRQQLRQIAEVSGGEAIAPEQLPKYLASLKGKVFTETLSQTDRKVWDNWPFLLIFTGLLVAEWAVRKSHGWV